MSDEKIWSKRKHFGEQVMKKKTKGATDYHLIEVFDRTGKDSVRDYYFRIIAPHPVADPQYLSSDKSEAERLFEDRTKLTI